MNKVHLRGGGRYAAKAVCGAWHYTNEVTDTDDLERVTCGACKSTLAFRNKRREAVSSSSEVEVQFASIATDVTFRAAMVRCTVAEYAKGVERIIAYLEADLAAVSESTGP